MVLVDAQARTRLPSAKLFCTRVDCVTQTTVATASLPPADSGDVGNHFAVANDLLVRGEAESLLLHLVESARLPECALVSYTPKCLLAWILSAGGKGVAGQSTWRDCFWREFGDSPVFWYPIYK